MLRGVAASLKPAGRVLFQMGGKGNGEEIFEVARELVRDRAWESYFRGFEFPWAFLGPEEYRQLLNEAGLSPRRVELLPRDLRQKGKDGLRAWVRTTWMPYTQKLPQSLREKFISEVVERYLAAHPLTPQGEAVVRMVRLEVEADKFAGVRTRVS